MNAAEVMDPHPTFLQATDTIEKGVGFIMSNRYRSIPVVDEHHCYMGMFGVNCLLKQVIPKAVFHSGLKNVGFIHESLLDLYHRFDEVRHEPISVCITQDILPVSPETPLTETLLQLYETRSSIPVVRQGSCELLGMISYFDVGAKILEAGAAENA